MDWLQVAGQAAGWLAQQPAVQGIIVAGATEAIKRAPVAPSGGAGIRLIAAVLALASVFATAAAQGDASAVDAQQVGGHLVEAVSAFLAAVGAWQLTRTPAA